MSAGAADITALVTAYEARYDSHVQRINTRQNAPGSASSADSTKLSTTAGDAIEEFEMHTGIEFTSSQRFHLSTGAELMQWLFLQRSRNYEGAQIHWDKNCLVRLDRIRKMRARALSVDSGTDKQDPTVPADAVKPDFDEFGGMWDDVGRARGIGGSALDETNPW